jgi:hypothetical protein
VSSDDVASALYDNGRVCDGLRIVSRQSRLHIDDVGAPDTIRTCGLRLRRATLYPAELRVHLLLTQCLREFLASVKRRAALSQVFVFRTSFALLFCTNWLDTCLRRAAVRRADDLLVTVYVRVAFISGGQARRIAKALRFAMGWV